MTAKPSATKPHIARSVKSEEKPAARATVPANKKHTTETIGKLIAKAPAIKNKNTTNKGAWVIDRYPDR